MTEISIHGTVHNTSTLWSTLYLIHETYCPFIDIMISVGKISLTAF